MTQPRYDAVFLDRDGVLNANAADGHYVETIDQCVVLAGAREAVARLVAQGLRLFIVTNQAGVGKGMPSEQGLAAIHEHMQQCFHHAFTAIRHCPHRIEDDCTCRKPRPGMITALAEHYHIHLPSALLIGDHETDIRAGHAAGVGRCVLVRSKRTGSAQAHAMYDSLLHAVEGECP